jgi:hypothetical protein
MAHAMPALINGLDNGIGSPAELAGSVAAKVATPTMAGINGTR